LLDSAERNGYLMKDCGMWNADCGFNLGLKICNCESWRLWVRGTGFWLIFRIADFLSCPSPLGERIKERGRIDAGLADFKIKKYRVRIELQCYWGMKFRRLRHG
jgi:hypothetical protein